MCSNMLLAMHVYHKFVTVLTKAFHVSKFYTPPLLHAVINSLASYNMMYTRDVQLITPT